MPQAEHSSERQALQLEPGKLPLEQTIEPVPLEQKIEPVRNLEQHYVIQIERLPSW